MTGVQTSARPSVLTNSDLLHPIFAFVIVIRAPAADSGTAIGPPQPFGPMRDRLPRVSRASTCTARTSTSLTFSSLYSHPLLLDGPPMHS